MKISNSKWSNETKAYIRQIVKELAAKEIITDLDESQLTLMGETYELYLKAKEAVDKTGLLVTGRGDEVKANPAASIMLRCQSQLLNVGREFGLTARSRKKIEGEQDTMANTPLSEFLERMKSEDAD